MKYLKLFEDKDWWDENDPFGEEIRYDDEELNFIYYDERTEKICLMRRKNNTLFRLISANWHNRRRIIVGDGVYHFINSGTAEYFRPKIPLDENIIKRIINDKIEVRTSKWSSERMTLSKLLRISNLELEDITFLDKKNIKKYI